MKIKRKIKPGTSETSIKERIEDFLFSDSIPANATKFLLAFIAVGSIAFGGAVVPGILKALKSFDLSEDKTGYDKKKIHGALGNLKRQKLVEVLKYDGDRVSIRLTNKGKRRIREYSIDTLEIKNSEKWDKKWRIVIFDIPNKYKQAREALREKIKQLGFKQLQKSVWIYPYECEDEVLFIAEIFEVERYVEIITAEKLLHGFKKFQKLQEK